MTMLHFTPRFGRYCLICITLLVWLATLQSSHGIGQESKKVMLQEKYRAGDQYLVETSSEVNGFLEVPENPLKPAGMKSIRKTGTAKSSYQERVLDVDRNNLATK